MTEADWLAAADPAAMLAFLRGKASERKLRLFAVACCRRVWNRLGDARSRRAVEFAERFADWPVSQSELAFVVKPAWNAATSPASSAAHDCVHSDALRAAADSSSHSAWAVPQSPRLDELRYQAVLLRDISGNPFRPAPNVESAWLAWNGGTVERLAESAYTERELPSGHLSAFRLALLADALEDAGCADGEILGHLRAAGPHVRGCCAVDRLTGRS
jgi:hypothetical protein